MSILGLSLFPRSPHRWGSPQNARYGAPRKFTMQISRCIFRSPAKTPTGDRRQKTHPSETVEQNVRPAKNNYVIAGEIHRRKRIEKVRAIMNRDIEVFLFRTLLRHLLFQKSIIAINLVYLYIFVTLNEWLSIPMQVLKCKIQISSRWKIPEYFSMRRKLEHFLRGQINFYWINTIFSYCISKRLAWKFCKHMNTNCKKELISYEIRRYKQIWICICWKIHKW